MPINVADYDWDAYRAHGRTYLLGYEVYYLAYLVTRRIEIEHHGMDAASYTFRSFKESYHLDYKNNAMLTRSHIAEEPRTWLDDSGRRRVEQKPASIAEGWFDELRPQDVDAGSWAQTVLAILHECYAGNRNRLNAKESPSALNAHLASVPIREGEDPFPLRLLFAIEAKGIGPDSAYERLRAYVCRAFAELSATQKHPAVYDADYFTSLAWGARKGSQEQALLMGLARHQTEREAQGHSALVYYHRDTTNVELDLTSYRLSAQPAAQASAGAPVASQSRGAGGFGAASNFGGAASFGGAPIFGGAAGGGSGLAGGAVGFGGAASLGGLPSFGGAGNGEREMAACGAAGFGGSAGLCGSPSLGGAGVGSAGQGQAARQCGCASAVSISGEQLRRYLEQVAAWDESVQERRVDPNAGGRLRNRNIASDSYEKRYVALQFSRCDTGESFDLVGDFLQSDARPSLLVLSDSGAGKTTFIRGLAALAAHGQLRDGAAPALAQTMMPACAQQALEAVAGLTPVVIAQPPYSETDSHGAEYEKYCGTFDPATFEQTAFGLLGDGYQGAFDNRLDTFRAVLHGAEKLLLIVDSIDEVPALYRQGFIRQLRSYVRSQRVEKLLVTSRHLGAEEMDALASLVGKDAKVQVDALTVQDRHALAAKISPAVRYEDLDCFWGSDAFLANPLLLTALARCREHQGVSLGSAVRRASDMLTSLGGDFQSEAVESAIAGFAYRSVLTGSAVSQPEFVETMSKAIAGSAALGERELASRVQSVLWRRGLFCIVQAEDGLFGADRVDFRYGALKCCWAALHLWKLLGAEWVGYAERGLDYLRPKDETFYPVRLFNGVKALLTQAADPQEAALTVLFLMDFLVNGRMADADLDTAAVHERLKELVYLGLHYPGASAAQRNACQALVDQAAHFTFGAPLDPALETYL